jgi:hypothetical protein
MNPFEFIDLTPDTLPEYGICGYKNAGKHEEIRRKAAWYRKYYPLGLRIRIVYSTEHGNQGMIEYIPGQYAHRPVQAEDYMFIHCLFVGFRKEFKGLGLASSLIEGCISDARKQGMHGVAVVTRKGPFMAGKDIFEKKGFRLADTAKPDFELLVLKFDNATPDPRFIIMETGNKKEGITIIRSAQCPYSVKNVNAIMETASRSNYPVTLIDADDAETAQHSPSAFGTFCILQEGKVISHHPISNTRFENILRESTGKK